MFGSCNKHGGKKTVLDNFKDVNPSQFEGNVKKYILSDGNPEKIQIKDWGKEQLLKLSTLFVSIEFVKLSDEPEAVIGNINKIVIQDTCIYILDRYKTKSLKKFSIRGEYLATIGTRGPGPEEYFEPTDFMVSKDEITVSDQFKSDLKFYNLSGHFQYAQRVPFIFRKFFFFSPNQYVFHANDADNNHLESILNWSVYETDSLFHINYKGFLWPNNKYIPLFVENNFYPYADKIFFHPTFNDTIYSISTNHHIQVEYIMDFPNGKIPEYYLLNENNKEFLKIQKDESYAFFPGNFVPMEDYLYFEYYEKNTIHRVVYSKKTKKAIVGSKILNDINYIFSYNNILTSTKDNVLVGYMQSYLIGDFFGDKRPRNKWVNEIGEENTRIAENIKSEDNPILLFFKIKDF